MEILIENRDFDGLKDVVKQEKKISKDEELVTIKIDKLVRKRGLKVVQCPTATIEEFARRHFNFVLQLTKAGICSKNVPVGTLQDFLETSSIEHCKLLFAIIEEHMHEFKQPPFNDQNTILRYCNDLLRRLSRTAETSFCGRIMFFLSRFLPLAEKSGLNLMGHFNTQNITLFDESGKDAESLMSVTPTVAAESEDMEVGEITEDLKEIQVTPEMYKQFWSFQRFLSNPQQIYDKDKYSIFKRDLSAILSLINTNKLDKAAVEDEDMERKSKRVKLSSDDMFFSKYLTSPKLLALQLNDSQLRRYFLLQCLIIFQYLSADVRFKVGPKKMVLNEEQTKFINDCEEKCYKLLAETLPRGSNFSSICKKILQREVEWSNWKNGGCSDFVDKADRSGMQQYKKRLRVEFNPNDLDLGSAELTKLWTNEPKVLEACKSDKRKFTPHLVDFIRDPLDESDPEQQVEEQYKSVNNPGFQWKASRLLLTAAPCYVSKLESKEPMCNMKEYLENTIIKTAKTMKEFKEEMEAREARESDANLRKKAEESLKRNVDGVKVASTTSAASPNPYNSDKLLTDEHLESLAEALSPKTKQLAEVFGIEEHEADKLLEKGTNKEFCMRILKDWTDKNGRTIRTLLNTLVCDVEIVEIASKITKKFSQATD